MVAGTLCCEFMAGGYSNSILLPGTRSVGRCGNKCYPMYVRDGERLNWDGVEQMTLGSCSDIAFNSLLILSIALHVHTVMSDSL